MFIEFEGELLNSGHIVRVTAIKESFLSGIPSYTFYIQLALHDSFLAYRYEDEGIAQGKRAELCRKLQEVKP